MYEYRSADRQGAMKYLIIILSCVACMNPPTTIDDSAPDAGGEIDCLTLEVDLDANGVGAWIFEWRQIDDALFHSMCARAPFDFAVSLSDRTESVTILAVQTGTDELCIEPQDGAFDDLVLWDGRSYRVTVLAEEKPDYLRLSFFNAPQ